MNSHHKTGHIFPDTRRKLNKIKYCVFLSFLLLVQSYCIKTEGKADVPPPITGTPLIWGFADHAFMTNDNLWEVDENGFRGYDNNGKKYNLTHPILKQIIEEFGFNLIVQEYARRPAATYKENILALRKMHDFFSGLDTKWIINTEAANHRISYIDANGYDWYNRSDGRHYYLFPDSILEALSEMENKPGILYDELAHMQNSRNITARSPETDIGVSIGKGGIDTPAFLSDKNAGRVGQASSHFTREAAKIVQHHARYGLQLYSEHVFPIMYHPLAKAGFTPVTKILKENCSPAYLACALGAAIQYDRPFWVTPDLYMDVHPKQIYPGHSAETYRSSLLLAYHMGAEGIYTERIGGGALIRENDERTDFELTDHGEVAKWFRWRYAPNNPRHYRYQDLRPRVVIIRQEDTDWGQSDSWLPDWLFGMKEWHSTLVTGSWLRIWSLLSNGKISPHSLSWHNNKVRNTPYHLFYPLDGVVVFDENAEIKHLKNAELIFLTGLSISQSTLSAVESCVKNGAVCVSLPHLVPGKVIDKTGVNGVFSEGKGKWLVTQSFDNKEVKRIIEPFLPKENHIRYRFGDTEVIFRPVDGNNDHITVEVKDVSN